MNTLIKILLIVVWAAGCRGPALRNQQTLSPRTVTSVRPSVRLIITAWPELQVILTNNADNPLRLWREWTPLGADMLSFATISVKGEMWSGAEFHQTGCFMGLPATYVIEPKHSIAIRVDLRDRQWSQMGVPPDWEKDVCYVSAVVHIASTPESEKYEVWTGMAFSAWEKVPRTEEHR